jgi:cyclase
MPTRRSFLKQSGLVAAATLIPGISRAQQLTQQNTPAPNTTQPQSIIQQLRAAATTTPIQLTKLRDTVFLLQSVGGNIVCQIGPDGKLLIDSGIATGARRLLQSIEKFDAHALKILINTHWHFDHTDGNAVLHDAGAFIIAQENTRLRLSTPQVVKAMGYQFPPVSTSALPQVTFSDREKVYFNNDQLDLIHAPNAHTDSDIFIHLQNANVIHTGDLWSNGMYPLIDDGTGGTINGMMQGVDQCIELADEKTKIVPGHGALGDKDALQKYREMLSTVANRVERLKIAGQTLNQVVAAKPTADLDSIWAKGNIKPDLFVTLVYNTL